MLKEHQQYASQKQKGASTERPCVREAIQIIHQTMLNYARLIPELYNPLNQQLQEQQALKWGRGPVSDASGGADSSFDTEEAVKALHFTFRLVQVMRHELLLLARPGSPDKFPLERLQAKWDTFFQQPKSVEALSYVLHVRELLSLIMALVPKLLDLRYVFSLQIPHAKPFMCMLSAVSHAR
jgi:hypothetical protein